MDMSPAQTPNTPLTTRLLELTVNSTWQLELQWVPLTKQGPNVAPALSPQTSSSAEFPTSVKISSVIPVVQPKNPGVILILHSHLPSNLSVNPIHYILKLYPEFNAHPLHCYHSSPDHDHLSPESLWQPPNSPPCFHPCPVSPLTPSVILLKQKYGLVISLCKTLQNLPISL